MATLTQITADADGTIDANITDSDTDAAFFDDCNDAPDGVSADYIELDAGLADGTYVAWLSLDNVDADFDSMDTLNIDIDLEIVGTPANDTVVLTGRIYDADNDTTNALTAETATLGDETDTTRVQRNVSFATLAGTKAQWDAAHLRLSFAYNRVTSADSYNLRIYGFDIDGTYTVATSGIDSKEKRAGVLGVARPWMRDKFPVATPDEQWRATSANTYGGNALTPAALAVPILDEGMLTGGLQPLGGGLE